MADDSHYGARRKPKASNEEEDDRFTIEERRELREFLRLLNAKKDDRPNIETIKKMIEQWKDLESIVEGKRVTAGVYRAVGEFAKWAGGIIAAIVAYKAYMAGGGK